MSNSGRPHGSPSGSSVPGILQARILEWVAISFSNAWKWKVKVKLLSRVQLFTTPWTVAYQAPLSMGFSRQEYWSGCHCLPCQEIEMLKEDVCAQSCPTLCEHMDCGPPGFSVHGILQTRILEWVGISFSRESTQGSNSCLLPLLHWQAGYQLSHWGSPKGRPLPEKRPEEGMTDEEGQTAPSWTGRRYILQLELCLVIYCPCHQLMSQHLKTGAVFISALFNPVYLVGT